MAHVINVSAGGGVRLFIDCSCDPDGIPVAVIEKPTATLDEITQIAHEHIESAERDSSR